MLLHICGKRWFIRLKSCPLSHPLRSPGNPSVCLHPQQQSGTLLHLLPEAKQINMISTRYCRHLMNESWGILRVYLACPYQFVVSELCQLSPQREVRVHQECLSTSLVEILEWQSCTEDKLITNCTRKRGHKSRMWMRTCVWRIIFVFQLELDQQFKDSSAKRKTSSWVFSPPTALYIMREVRLEQNLEQKSEMSE